MLASTLSSIDRLSRREFATDPALWRGAAVTYLALSIGVLVATWLPVDLEDTRVRGLAAALAVIGSVWWFVKPPAVATAGNHLALATISGSVATGVVVFGPTGVIALTCGVFIAAMVPLRLVRRREIVAHVAGGSVLLSAAVATSAPTTDTVLAAVSALPAIWILAACITLVLEEAERQSRRVRELAHLDPLTGLGNRRLLDERLAQELSDHAADRDNLSVLTLDLDGFKALNDHVGHAAGDRVLRAVADVLREAVAAVPATLIRQGGDEFCVLLPRTNEEAAARLEGVIATQLAALTQEGVPISAGSGRATYPVDAITGHALLEVADRRLRANKAARSAQRHARPATPLPLRALDDRRRSEPRPLSRRSIAASRTIWAVTGCSVSAYGALPLIYSVLEGRPALPEALIALAAGLLACWTAVAAPPKIGRPANHLLLITLLTLLTAGLLTPGGAAMLGSALFVAPLVSSRLARRGQIACYLGAYSLALLVISSLAVSGAVSMIDPALALALITPAIVTPLVGLSCVLVLEAAERHGQLLADLARQDPLTGAGNRRQLDKFTITPAGRHLGVVLLDYNGFKRLNDDYGHAAGDALLRASAQAMRSALPDGSTLIRLGGDEFCVVIEHATERELRWTEDVLRNALAQIDTPAGTLSAGFGSAMAPGDGTCIDELLNAADARLLIDKATPALRRVACLG